MRSEQISPAETVAWCILITAVLLLLTLPQWMPRLVDATYPHPADSAEMEESE